MSLVSADEPFGLSEGLLCADVQEGSLDRQDLNRLAAVYPIRKNVFFKTEDLALRKGSQCFVFEQINSGANHALAGLFFGKTAEPLFSVQRKSSVACRIVHRQAQDRAENSRRLEFQGERF